MKIVVGSFASKPSLTQALPQLRAANLGMVQTFTPAMLEDPDAKPSILPMVVLIAGVAGTLASFGLQSYANIVSYPVDIGGRPTFSWPAFVPIAFENGVLLAVLAGFFGYFVVNRLPSLYWPEDESLLLRRASRDRWCVAIRTDVPERAGDFLAKLDAEVEEVPA